MKIVYQYNEVGEFICQTIAYEDPRNPGSFPLPPMTTEEKPPATKKNQVAVWNNEKWEIKSDFRGDTVYKKATGEPLTVDYIGDIKEEHTKTPPPDEYHEWLSGKWVEKELTEKEITAKLKNQFQKIDNETSETIYGGFGFDGQVFSMSQSAQANWLFLLVQYTAGKFPDEWEIATKDDGYYLLTKEKAPSFFEACARHKEATLSDGRVKKRNLEKKHGR